MTSELSDHPTIRLLTLNASHDDLNLDDYRQIYQELREGRPLREFVELLTSAYSIAWWSRWERGNLRLTRAARNELRRAVGLRELSPVPAEFLANSDIVSPDAAVYRVDPVGATLRGCPDMPDPATRVILIGEQTTAVDLHVNNTVSILDPAPGSHVTAVTKPTRRALRKTVHLSPAAWNRLNTARQDAGATWEDFLSSLLRFWTIA